MEQQLKQDLLQLERSFSSDHYGRVENIRRDFKQCSHHKPITTINSQDYFRQEFRHHKPITTINSQDYFRQEFRHHKPIKTINGQDYCRQEDVLWDLHPYPVGTKSGANLVVGADSLRSAEDGAGPETGAKNQQV